MVPKAIYRMCHEINYLEFYLKHRNRKKLLSFKIMSCHKYFLLNCPYQAATNHFVLAHGFSFSSFIDIYICVCVVCIFVYMCVSKITLMPKY